MKYQAPVVYRQPTPRMDPGARNWMLKTVKEKYRDVADWYDITDLIQDGHVCYLKVRRVYPHMVDPPHIMAAFKSAFINHIKELSRRKRVRKEITYYAEPEQFMIGEACPLSELRLLVVEAPEHLRLILQHILDHPECLTRPPRRGLDGRRETTSEWLANMIGQDHDELLAESLKTYLTHLT